MIFLIYCHVFTECPAKSFKNAVGNFNCTRCGANVEDGLKPRTTPCKCNNGYYRPLLYKNVPTVDCEGELSLNRLLISCETN